MSKHINDDLLQRIQEGEGITTEFKSAKDKLPNNLFETVCSFLNRNGGHIFLGINDSGKIEGVSENYVLQMKKDFVNLCNNTQKINPTIYLNINDYEIDGKIILHIYVNESSSIHSTNKKIFDRNEDGDYEAKTPHQITQICLRKQQGYSENKVFPYATMDDLNPNLIKQARQMAINFNKNEGEHPWAHLNDEELLRSANLFGKDLITGKEGLTLAAILLFGKDETILNALPHHKTDAIYRVKNLDRYDDRDDIRTNLLDSYDRLMAFINKHLDDRFYVEGVQRIDLRYKIGRELVANTLMHREYLNPYPAKLIIEKDVMRTENANNAKMIGKLDIENYEPYPKNPKIAKVFKEIGLADELGSGFRNIVKYTKVYSGGTPELKEADVFRTTVPINDEELYLEQVGGKLGTSTGQVQDKYRTSTGQVQDKSEFDQILEFCKEPKTLKEIMNIVNKVGRDNFRNNYLLPLLEKGLLQMTIPDKPNSSKQKYITVQKN